MHRFLVLLVVFDNTVDIHWLQVAFEIFYKINNFKCI